MNIMKFCAMLLVLTLSACANTQAEGYYNNWVRNARVQAERGEIKWSDYYQGCFSRLMEVSRGNNGKLFELEYYNALIDFALEHESGRISRLEFENKRRRLQLEYVRREELANKNRSSNATIFVYPSF